MVSYTYRNLAPGGILGRPEFNANANMHSEPANEQIQATQASLDRLISELQMPHNRELVRFLVAWRGLEQELTKLKAKIQERVAEKPVNKLNQFLQQLKKKQ